MTEQKEKTAWDSSAATDGKQSLCNSNNSISENEDDFNIDDENYDKQLNGYKEFIKVKTSKEVECYLYSIIDQKYRKVL